MKDRLYVFFLQHRWTAGLILAGLVLFILIVTINFWRTLLLLLILCVCAFFGRLMDKGGWNMVKSFFDRVLPK